ncbi:glycosyltransferase [Candidatus Uhrbacteria bacterium]|nr:glycosyltransferase [Candidatus Uhrbacteria bacterium]
MKPLIAHVLWSLGHAGAERVVFDLARSLPQHGFRTMVIAAGGGGTMKKEFEKAGIQTVVGPSVSTLHRGQTIHFLKQQIQKFKPAIWHSHLSDIWAGLAIKGKHVPWVITAHNDDQDDGWLQHRARGIAFRHADQVVCVSSVVETYVKKEFGVPASRLSVIRNGIDFDRFIPRTKMIFSEPVRLMTNGRLVAQKDQATLLQALALVKDRLWELEIIGEGSEREHLKQLARDGGIASRVHFSGTVTDIPHRLSEADLFCFPSRWEGQGLALLEAAEVGLPIIASDLPIFREVFDEKSMTLIKPQDPRAWAHAIKYAIDHPEKALHKSRRAQEQVREAFALDRMVSQYVDLYRLLLAT